MLNAEARHHEVDVRGAARRVAVRVAAGVLAAPLAMVVLATRVAGAAVSRAAASAEALGAPDDAARIPSLVILSLIIVLTVALVVASPLPRRARRATIVPRGSTAGPLQPSGRIVPELAADAAGPIGDDPQPRSASPLLLIRLSVIVAVYAIVTSARRLFRR